MPEGGGGTCRGAGGRRQGLAGLRADAPNLSAHQEPLAWRAPEGPAAVPVGGGRAWQGYSQRPSPTGVEGAGGTGGHGRASRRGAERSEVA